MEASHSPSIYFHKSPLSPSSRICVRFHEMYNTQNMVNPNTQEGEFPNKKTHENTRHPLRSHAYVFIHILLWQILAMKIIQVQTWRPDLLVCISQKQRKNCCSDYSEERPLFTMDGKSVSDYGLLMFPYLLVVANCSALSKLT